jgi:hypothetical protein
LKFNSNARRIAASICRPASIPNRHVTVMAAARSAAPSGVLGLVGMTSRGIPATNMASLTAARHAASTWLPAGCLRAPAITVAADRFDLHAGGTIDGVGKSMGRIALSILLLALGGPAPAKADLSDDVRPPVQCSSRSCIDPRTGDYTQSVCDATGCRQLGGVVGRLSPREKRRMLGRRPPGSDVTAPAALSVRQALSGRAPATELGAGP